MGKSGRFAFLRSRSFTPRRTRTRPRPPHRRPRAPRAPRPRPHRRNPPRPRPLPAIVPRIIAGKDFGIELQSPFIPTREQSGIGGIHRRNPQPLVTSDLAPHSYFVGRLPQQRQYIKFEVGGPHKSGPQLHDSEELSL